MNAYLFPPVSPYFYLTAVFIADHHLTNIASRFSVYCIQLRLSLNLIRCRSREPSQIGRRLGCKTISNFSSQQETLWKAPTTKRYFKPNNSKKLAVCTIADVTDAFYLRAKYEIDCEPRDIIVFREGMAVFWNVPYEERTNFLRLLRDYEEDPFDTALVKHEAENMEYTYNA